jgi:glycosyltransferase involved in cell wall biosynthesis
LRVGVSSTSIERHLTKGKKDGIGVYTDNLVSNLSQIKDVEIEKFYYPSSLTDAFFSSGKSRSSSLHVPYPYSGFLSNVCGMYDINQGMIESRVDVYHATDYKILKLKNIPVVATLYDAIPLKHPDWVSPRLRWLKNRILVNSAKWADHVITISEFVAKDIQYYWRIPREKISVVHCGVSEYWAEQQDADEIEVTKREYGIGKAYILFVGTFQPRKNIDRIIEVYKALPIHVRNQFQLVLVGKIGWRSEHLLQPIQDLAQRGDCVWVKNATDDDLRRLYQGSSVFMFPSLSEGFGLPVLEAFASKVPVITSKGTALEEVAGDAAYLVDPYSLDEMVNALSEVLLLDDDSNQRLIQKGVNRNKQFSWVSAAQKIYDIYKNVI